MTRHRPFAWARYREATKDQRARLIVSARKAVTSEPGSRPEVWPLYSSAGKDWIFAEHFALGIWATHQQVHEAPVHAPQTEGFDFPPNFGGACRELFDTQFAGNVSIRSPLDTLAEDTITKRLAVLSRTDELPNAASHMLSLVRLMNSTGKAIGFNYDDLFWTIRSWTDLGQRTDALYRWSASYFYAPPDQAAGVSRRRREERT